MSTTHAVNQRIGIVKNKYIREEELIEELFKVIDKVSINELDMQIELERRN